MLVFMISAILLQLEDCEKEITKVKR